jgi:Popeye protein conserved region
MEPTYFVHGANVLYLLSYLVRDILWLRTLCVAAASTMLPYFFLRGDRPDWVPISWSTLSILINVIQISLLLLERRPVRLPADDQRLYQLTFRSLTPREFQRLLAAGSWRTAAPGEQLIAHGAATDKVLVVFDGEAVVVPPGGGAALARLGAGRFIGEMSFITGEPTSADVEAATELRYVAWEAETLRRFVDKHTTIRSALQLTLGSDLASKLRMTGSARP